MMRKLSRLLALFLLLSLILSCVAMANPETQEPGEPDAPATPEDPAEPDAPEDPTEPEAPEYVFPDDWSRDALIFAVENGILAGDENRNLHPADNITRAEMAAVLVRLLGATKSVDLSAYTDVPEDAWYYKELSAAVAAGIFGGVSDTQMNPGANITREQAVVVLCRAFGIVSMERELYKEFSDGGGISAYARDSVSSMREMEMVNGYSDGSFLPQNPITRAEVAQLLYNIFDVIADSPEELPESGWALYRGTEALPDTMTLDGTLILGQNTPSPISAADWSITEALILRTGEDTQAKLGGLSVEKLVCAPLSGSVEADAQTVCLWGKGTSYVGSAQKLICVDGSHSAKGSYDTLELRAGKLILEGEVSHVSLLDHTHLTLNGTAQNISVDGRGVIVDGSGHAAYILINFGDFDISVSYDEMDDDWYQEYQKEHDNALNVVQTMRVACTVQKDTALYKSTNGTDLIRSLPAGTIVYNEWHPAGDWFYASLEDGTKGWIPRWDCYIPDDTVTTDGTLDYSKATKEGFVDLMGYDSKTEYLIWVSRYTQKVIVYQGSQGDWEVIQTFPCSSGENNTPTPEGIYEIYDRTGRWNFDFYYVNDVSIFSGGHAFHSILMNYNGSVYDDRVGIPLSHGCIRMLPDDCAYIYDLPEGTRVIVY